MVTFWTHNRDRLRCSLFVFAPLEPRTEWTPQHWIRNSCGWLWKVPIAKSHVWALSIAGCFENRSWIHVITQESVNNGAGVVPSSAPNCTTVSPVFLKMDLLGAPGGRPWARRPNKSKTEANFPWPYRVGCCSHSYNSGCNKQSWRVWTCLCFVALVLCLFF